MKRLSAYLALAAVTMMTLAPAITAQGCRTFARTPHIVERPHVVEKVVVEKIKAIAAIEFVTPVLPIYNVPPAYGALYYPPQAFGAPGYRGQPQISGGGYQQQTADPCAELKARYGALEQRLLRLEGGGDEPLLKRRGAPPPMPKAEADQPEQVEEKLSGNGFVQFAVKNCASCHEGTSAKLKGGSFVLFGSKGIADLTPEQSGEVIRRLTLPHGDPKAMPKGKRLSADDKLQGVRLFVGGDDEPRK